MESLRGVRHTLDAWTPPETALGFKIVSEAPAPQHRWALVSSVPRWGFAAAAAVVVLAAGAAIANLEVRVGTDGVVLRTGWADDVAATGATSPNGVTATDLSRVEQQLRSELAALGARQSVRRVGDGSGNPVGVAGSARQASQGEILRQVRELIDASERRQDRELALRLTQVHRELDAQHQTDLVRIQQGFGQLNDLTDYLVQVSQR